MTFKNNLDANEAQQNMIQLAWHLDYISAIFLWQQWFLEKCRKNITLHAQAPESEVFRGEVFGAEKAI